MFHTTTHSLVLHDTMKMAKWQQTSEWGAKRGPDPILQFFDFANELLSSVSRKMPATQICEFLLDQNHFNGVGNYLRAEILVRAGLDPFAQVADVFKNSPKSLSVSTLNSILQEGAAPLDAQKAMHSSLKHDPGLLVIYLARQIQLEVLANGGMNKYGSADEQERFKSWLRVYGKGKEVKVGSRSVHCTPEQRLGKQERDLGLFINTYPYDLPPIYYKAPTISIAPASPIGATGSAGTQLSRPSSGVASSAQPAPAPSGTFQIKRVDEVILPCDKIADLHVPVMTKLLLAVTSLSRNGKLNFMIEPSVRELVLIGHPIAYAAWQAFETNMDEDELVDTFIRLARKTEPQMLGNKRLYEAIDEANEVARLENSLLAMERTSHMLADVSLHGPSFTEPSFVFRGKEQKIRRGDRMASFGSSTPSSSTSGSTAGSDDESSDSESLSSSKPTKKKAVAHRGHAVSEKTKTAKKKSSKFDVPVSLSGAKKSFGSSFGSPSPSSLSSFGLADSQGGSSDKFNLVSLLTEPSWVKILTPLGLLSVLKPISEFLGSAYASKGTPPVYPAREDIFTAFNVCPLDQVKVVIIGQDPYHGAGQAHGLCFSVLDPTPVPPSLANIFKELQADIPGFKIPKSGNLAGWAEQGVFLLNTVLTVYEQKPNSHAKLGWHQFTDMVVRAIATHCTNVVFLLWGKPAQDKMDFLKDYTNQHSVLKTVHPSPLSAHQGWYGSKHFSKANALLAAAGKTPIDWSRTQPQK